MFGDITVEVTIVIIRRRGIITFSDEVLGPVIDINFGIGSISKLPRPIRSGRRSRNPGSGRRSECRARRRSGDAYSSEGCETITPRSGRVECRCNHATTYAVLSVPDETTQPSTFSLVVIVVPVVVAVVIIVAIIAIVGGVIIAWRKKKTNKYNVNPVFETERGQENVYSLAPMPAIGDIDGDNIVATGGSTESLNEGMVKPVNGDDGMFVNESASTEM